ncbi:hypothetical protein SAMN05444411_102229 [Lutibacter oricola]|uniref:Uncharacterized protein n=1 Tax=Lutibacter oricola TaxID=762486 RepID=A0A1H2WLF5_9FLAO|nr:hypothetical protein [Lutibacter oricola]SDW81357.1 hypothetical protein SAMN05444411_102229 [Lutibacter oricola]
MNYNDFFNEAKKRGVSIELDNPNISISHKLSNEALFHLPLLAMTILLLSKDRSKPKSEELGQLVGECFERTFKGFKGSSQYLGWSANLRMRTVKALTFLEAAGLVMVDVQDPKIKITKMGKKVITKAIDGNTDLGYNLQLIERKYRNIRVEKQISIGIA